MKTYTAICPECRAVNEGLYLDETDGSFECSHCLSVWQADSTVYDRAKRKINRSRTMLTAADKMSIAPEFAAANV